MVSDGVVRGEDEEACDGGGDDAECEDDDEEPCHVAPEACDGGVVGCHGDDVVVVRHFEGCLDGTAHPHERDDEDGGEEDESDACEADEEHEVVGEVWVDAVAVEEEDESTDDHKNHTDGGKNRKEVH